MADAARASFLHEYLSRRGRPPAGLLRTALQILASREHHYGSPAIGRRAPTQPDADPDTAGDVFVEAVAKTTANRLPLLALAYAAATAEANMRSRQAPWQFDPALAVQWLTVLEGRYPGHRRLSRRSRLGPAHPERRRYYRVVDGRPPAAVPDWLTRRLQPRTPKRPQGVRRPVHDAYGRAAVAGECTLVRQAQARYPQHRPVPAAVRLGTLLGAGVLVLKPTEIVDSLGS